jgi:hypothetical protein
LKLGQVTTLDGTIEETKRAGTDVPGWQTEYADRLETYSLDELGFDEDYISLGIELEKQWTYVTVLFEASYMSLSADEVARRNYFLGVDEIKFGGQEYEYMMIPQGSAYEGDLQGMMLCLEALITPFSLKGGETMVITPWLHLGLFSTVGYYEIDAGTAQGVIQYEIPPREYVVGGKGDGAGGLVLPEIGLGGDLKVKVGQVEAGPVNLTVRGDVAIMQFDGSTDQIGIDARHDKDIDLEYLSYELRVGLEIPLKDSNQLLVSLGYEFREADAELEAVEAVDIEKYDKDVEFEMERLYASIGLLF